MGTPAFPEDNEKNKRTTGVVRLIDAVASASSPTHFDHWRIARHPGSAGQIL
jgi:hypothetical protein